MFFGLNVSKNRCSFEHTSCQIGISSLLRFIARVNIHAIGCHLAIQNNDNKLLSIVNISFSLLRF